MAAAAERVERDEEMLAEHRAAALVEKIKAGLARAAADIEMVDAD
jgi:hypothetical protein